MFSFCAWTAKQLLVFLNRVFEKGLFKCAQTHSQHKHLLMESVWRNLRSVCHHRSELWCHFVDTTHPNHQPECDIKDLTKTSCPGLPDFNKLQLRVDMGRCSSMYNAPTVAHGCPCVCACFFVFCSCETHLPLTESGSSQLGGGGNRAWSTKRGKKKNWLQWQSVALVADWATTSSIHSPAFHLSLFFNSSTSPVTQLWVIKLRRRGGWWLGDLEGGIRVRGGDRVLTHRLSNGFQRPPRLPGSVQYEG